MIGSAKERALLTDGIALLHRSSESVLGLLLFGVHRLSQPSGPHSLLVCGGLGSFGVCRHCDRPASSIYILSGCAWPPPTPQAGADQDHSGWYLQAVCTGHLDKPSGGLRPKMAQLADLVWAVNLVIRLYPKYMWTHSKLTQGNTKSVHPMAECVIGPDNETVPQIHEVLSVESHLRT
jgi:hypothetical protein